MRLHVPGGGQRRSDPAIPTDAGVSFYEVGVWRLSDGKIAESWFLADETALIRSLGMLGAAEDR